MSQALFDAARSGDSAQIKAQLEAGADPAMVDEAGETALMHAAHGGHVAAVQVLLAAGADVNAKAPSGWTALARAAYNDETDHGYVEVVEILADAGASLDERIFFGITPLMLAAGGGDASVVEWLINAGALNEAERQLGVSEDGSCSSTKSVVKPHVVNLMKPTAH
ncbi:MAG: ankyrin repeat domain-containing protein [Thiobacillus sp.]|nr:ankyrin repeat domain-containing protein [Thiobacillus sp.]